MTTPITNDFFHKRITALVSSHLSDEDSVKADPIVTPLTTADTTLFPGPAPATMIAYSAPWIDLCSENPAVGSVSRQVLNMELSYAAFIGLKTVILPGPRVDNDTEGNCRAITQYARAIQEVAQHVARRLDIAIHLPMYRDPASEERCQTLSDLVKTTSLNKGTPPIELFSVWDAWNQIRTMTNYDSRLGVALRIPKGTLDQEIRNRWLAEPVWYLSIGPSTFQLNHKGQPHFSSEQQQFILRYMQLKEPPHFLLCDTEPTIGVQSSQLVAQSEASFQDKNEEEYPTLEDASRRQKQPHQSVMAQKINPYITCLRSVEQQQAPVEGPEAGTLRDFQDWLQNPLQPLADNLDSRTYQVFENDPVKYNQYERAIEMALVEWSQKRKPTSSSRGAVVLAVAGAGRGPLVSRALKAASITGVAIELWAVEKNPSAYVFLLRKNEMEWKNQVKICKTDMRAWKGPMINQTVVESRNAQPQYGKVDILISELLGSFGDNELSPECLDGIQHVMAPHSISIPKEYSSWITPIISPKLHVALLSKHNQDAFRLPWVVNITAFDYASPKGVPDKPRFQKAWDFKHPIPASVLESIGLHRSSGTAGGAGGALAHSTGINDHNSRMCHLTFVCRTRGVIHGLGGFFESILYEKSKGINNDSNSGLENVELSILPDQMDKKNKNMTSWFPIFFPLDVGSLL